jgi:hypothetical protein
VQLLSRNCHVAFATLRVGLLQYVLTGTDVDDCFDQAFCAQTTKGLPCQLCVKSLPSSTYGEGAMTVELGISLVHAEHWGRSHAPSLWRPLTFNMADRQKALMNELKRLAASKK